MSWIILVAAGLFEVAWASLLGETNGFRRPLPTIAFLVTLAVSMCLLSVPIRTIPIGTAYAVWVGIGAAGAFLVSVLWRVRRPARPRSVRWSPSSHRSLPSS